MSSSIAIKSRPSKACMRLVEMNFLPLFFFLSLFTFHYHHHCIALEERASKAARTFEWAKLSTHTAALKNVEV
jgi:hypothetical protein